MASEASRVRGMVKPQVKKLRTDMTDAERKLWRSLRLRFWNNDVLGSLEGVLTVIADASNPSPVALLRNAPPSPSRGEGRKQEGPQ